MNFQEKVVLITGAGSGIGQHLAIELLSRGARVAAVDIRRTGLEETAAMADAGERLSLHEVDITDRAKVEALPEEILARHGAIDVVINNAGAIQPFERLNDLDFEAIDRMIQINLYGTLYVTKAFLPLLRERPEAYIANVSSMGAFLPVPGQAVYGASKAAVKLLTEALFAELIDTNVGVSLVMPGAINTNIAENSGVVLDLPDEDSPRAGRAMAADQAAKVIADGIEKKQLHILVGSDAKLMHLANRLAPKSSIRLIQRQMKDLLGADD